MSTEQNSPSPDSENANPRQARGTGVDAQKVANRLQNFDIKKSIAYQKISAHFKPGISHPELKRVAEILAQNLNLHLDRDAKRDNRVLIKWFDENWSVLENEIVKIKIYDSELNLIS